MPNVVRDPKFTDSSLWAIGSGRSFVSSPALRGGRSVQVDPGASSAFAVYFDNDSTRLPVTPGEKYRFSVVYETNAAFNGTSNNTKLRVAKGDGSLLTAASVPNAITTTGPTLVENEITIPSGVTEIQISASTDHTAGLFWWEFIGVTLVNLASGEPASRMVVAFDYKTLATQASITYVRPYFKLQSSSLSAPAAPTTDPPGNGWVTTEPAYTPGSTNTLYTVMITRFGSDFIYSEVSKDSSYEAAKLAYNTAIQAGEAADNALTAANGKSKMIQATAAPLTVTGYSPGDQWWVYSGTEVTAIYVLVAGSPNVWTSQTLRGAVLTNLDAGRITVGTLNAARIGANTITVSKLAIADFTNLFPTSHWDGAGSTMGLTAKNSTDAGVPAGAPYRTVGVAINGATHDFVSARPGDKLWVEFYAATSDATTSVMQVGLQAQSLNTSTGATSTGTYVSTVPTQTAALPWTKYTAVLTVPATIGGYPPSKIRPYININASDIGKWYITGAVLRRMMGGELVVDGAITGSKVNAVSFWADEAWIRAMSVGVITAEMIKSGAGAQIDLNDNGSITFLMGQQNGLTDDLNTLSETVIENADSITDVQNNMTVLENDIGSADAKANAAQQTADAALSQAQETANYYRFTQTDGLQIGQAGETYVLKLDNDEIGIYNGETKLTWWNEDELHVKQLTVEEAITIGVHRVEKRVVGSETRTIFRKAS